MDKFETDVESVLEIAAGLCGDTPKDSEYVRGQAELICDLLGLPMDNGKDVVIAAITRGTR